MSSDPILFETRGNVAIITLNLEKKLNALTQDHYYHIAQLLQQIAGMDDIYVTVLTAKGRFFSAGADVTVSRPPAAAPSSPSSPSTTQRTYLQSFVSNNLHVTRTFYTHPKILITALNGPAIGLSAALIALSDFIYAAPHAYLLTPFTSLGLVAEGGASRAFVQRLGISKANEALIMSKRITAEEMLQTGFVNAVFYEGSGGGAASAQLSGGAQGVGSDKEGLTHGSNYGLKPQAQPQSKSKAPFDSTAFLARVLHEIDDRLTGGHLVLDSLLKTKALVRRPEMEVLDRQNVLEVFGGLERFVAGVPQEEFRKIAGGEKKHKL